MGSLTNVRSYTVFERNIGFNADIAVLRMDNSYSERRKCCVFTIIDTGIEWIHILTRTPAQNMCRILLKRSATP